MPATFQVYRFSDDEHYWWRLVSPHGRGVARMPRGARSVQAVRDAVRDVVAGLDELTPVLRLTDTYRWQWSLHAPGGIPVARGIGDQDRRVRCEQACRTFVAMAAAAAVDGSVATFRRVGAPSRPG
ncbi:hypothetical protein [Cellulomonas sp. HZM]|uniref:hypothetical protein n=1 Tax=Cellulomonas sp. HZM TaxID=1454010 RepID=UPI0004932E9D|nr:hypothetical protein [Cellulomonas sp. HZM]